ncbi:multidrug efflux SMR transporter [Planococcus sp. ISL-109]|uniref:DMT family transporter n=1 Tax=Planococcus sp. ISL-109 TaxID=2819166 RepID=UPI001BE9EAA1|nr:multidrug efflux SMR transporter [Planococcus sp. ISL-109]MBT2581642.1 multidrug efflux SMR transporter [Planococcus sp. ISL-109]
MGWIYLLCAGAAEIVYAATMPKTNGFTKLAPSLFAIFFIAVSMYLLSLSTRTIPIGTAYAIWVGIGAVGTAIYGMAMLGEEKNIAKMICLMFIVFGIVGLKLFSGDESRPADTQ